MGGDKYQIFYSESGNSVLHETVDDWKRAKEIRSNLFNQNPSYRAVWIMRGNPSLEVAPRRYGCTLRRTRREVV